MSTSEWISRNVSKLLPAAGSRGKAAVVVPVEPLADSAAKRNAQDGGAAQTAQGSALRSTRERLVGTLRHKEEALSPRVLRRTLTELQAVVDPQVSEIEGGRRAMGVARWYQAAKPDQRRDCWLLMSEQFGPDLKKVQLAREHYDAAQNTPDEGPAEIRLRRALVSPRTRLLQRFAVFPQGMRFLIDLRAELLPHLRGEKRLLALDAELENLFSTWFDVAFLELRRISWDSPASLLEKLIQYEAVHDIRSWSDLKNRLDSDRRCYGFFHPQLPNEPLIFVEVALLDELPAAIAPLLDETAAAQDLAKATTAIFYSISSTQTGLRGISFGDSLIKHVVQTLKAEFAALKTFATLSPMPGFRTWLGKNAGLMLDKLEDKARAALVKALGLESVNAAQLLQAAENALELDAKAPLRHFLLQCAAHYIGSELANGKPLDPVTRFHLGNGARIERLNWAGDRSAKGFKQSYGMMVNYLYDLKRLDHYRAQFASSKIAVSSDIKALKF